MTTRGDNLNGDIPNQKKAFVKEVSVHLNGAKKIHARESSMPETHRNIGALTQCPNSRPNKCELKINISNFE
jgi:hypothetical protein